MELQKGPIRVKQVTAAPNYFLKGLIIQKYGGYKPFILALKEKKNGVRINEMRLSRIVNGRLSPTKQERRWFSWVLQVPADELFPEG